MSKSQQLYLLDILDRINRIQQVAASGEEIFRHSSMHQDAIIRSFEVIGEVVKRLDDDLIAKYPTIHWADYAGFCDILIHQYDKVLLDIVWESVQSDLSPLRLAVETILIDLNKSSGIED